MSDAEIVAEVRSFFVKELLEGDDRGLDATTSLVELGLIGSLSTLMLAEFVLGRFGVELRAELLTPERLGSLVAIADLIASERTAQGRFRP